jgi:hypothetical protein
MCVKTANLLDLYFNSDKSLSFIVGRQSFFEKINYTLHYFCKKIFVIIIDNIYVSNEVVEEQFVCDLQRCKGDCCVEGDAGAPLTEEEKLKVDALYEKVKPLMTQEGKEVVKQSGHYVYDTEFGWVTPTIGSGMCVYGFRDKSGIFQCSFETIYNEGQSDWKKPISCHLFPVKISQSEKTDIEYVNYEPRETLCTPACVLGKKLKIPVYQFLKEPLIRKYGEEFYEILDQIAGQYFDPNKTSKEDRDQLSSS